MELGLFYILGLLAFTRATDVDEKGYVMFCPCMGRFGNQADHYLGALAFAKGLDRTLVVPPLVEYRVGHSKSVQVPFENYFDLAPLSEFHRYISMEEFMRNKTWTKAVWPEERRKSFCYSHRIGAESSSCNAKEGNPFKSFWDTFDIEFSGGSETYGPLHYDFHHSKVENEWKEAFPSAEFPVLAFTGAPAAFPVQKENVFLHKFLFNWNERMKEARDRYISDHLAPRGKYIGVHLRHGSDWKNACQYVESSRNLFASAQCLGYRNENGNLTEDICYPPIEVIVRQLRRALHTFDSKTVFVATDDPAILKTLTKHFPPEKSEVRFFRLEKDQPHLDLAILGRANHFIGNCVSSFTAFVKRERDVAGLPSSFWAFQTSPERAKNKHQELKK